MKEEQRKMRNFVKAFMASPEEKIQEASPEKIGKTGNVVLDKINIEVEKQRMIFKAVNGSTELFDPDILLSSDSEAGEEDKKDGEGADQKKEGKPDTKNILKTQD